MEFLPPDGEPATAGDVVIENCAIATMDGRQWYMLTGTRRRGANMARAPTATPTRWA